MRNPFLWLAQALYREPTEKLLTDAERRRELQAHYALFFLFFFLAVGLAFYLCYGSPTPLTPSDLLAAVPLLCGVFLYALWLKQKARLEYFYLALFSTITGVLQIRFTQAYVQQISPADTASLDIFMLAVEGGFGLLLAMAFARSRALIFRVGLPLIVAVPVILQPLVRLTALDFPLLGFMSSIFVPACFAMGSLACFLQGVALQAKAMQARARWVRLNIYALGFFALFVCSLREASWWAAAEQAPHLRLPEIGVPFVFLVLSLLEYQAPKSNSSGFTLIELMIVVAVIGLLAALAGPMYERHQAKARQGEAKINLSAVYASEKAFFAEYSAYVSAFEALHFQPEGSRRFYTLGWSAPMTGTVTSYGGGYNTPNYPKANVPSAFGCDVATGTSVLPPPVGSNQHTFRVGAAGGVRIGLACDIWTIDDEKTLSNSVTAI